MEADLRTCSGPHSAANRGVARPLVQGAGKTTLMRALSGLLKRESKLKVSASACGWWVGSGGAVARAALRRGLAVNPWHAAPPATR